MKDPLWETYKFVFNSALENESKGIDKFARPMITILVDGYVISGRMATFEDYLADTKVLARHFSERLVDKTAEFYRANDEFLFLSDTKFITGNSQIDLPKVVRIKVSNISGLLDGAVSIGDGG